MKGRRKLKTTKWQDQERYRFEALSILSCRKGSGSFLDRAAIFGTESEPLGKLAGLKKHIDI